MRNLLIALTVGAIGFSALFFPGFLRLGEAMVPAVFVMMLAYFLLARRTMKQFEAIVTGVGKKLQTPPPRFDQAIRTLEGAYPLASWQFGIKSQISSQIGTIYFLQKEFNKALPYLQTPAPALLGHWMPTAMLAVVQYKKKQHEQVKQTLKTVIKQGKKEALPWCFAAYLYTQVGEQAAAQATLVDGLKATKDDQRVKDALLAVQNNKKIKMRAFKEQWYQFHLERPPAQYQQQQIPMRMGKRARRGKW